MYHDPGDTAVQIAGAMGGSITTVFNKEGGDNQSDNTDDKGTGVILLITDDTAVCKEWLLPH